jgi:hypothetical protein
MSEFTHINAEGRAKMVNVGDKAFTDRTAVARGEVIMQPETIEKIKKGAMKKGDVLGVAQVAGIAGAKKTWELIPMCHNIFISGCAYEDANNGNVSAVHWDLVMIQRPEYGGGEIYFDDVLIRKDGLFVLPELEVLNPENLK